MAHFLVVGSFCISALLHFALTSKYCLDKYFYGALLCLAVACLILSASFLAILNRYDLNSIRCDRLRIGYAKKPRERNSGEMFRRHGQKRWRKNGENFRRFSAFYFQEKWAQELSRKIGDKFGWPWNKILSPRDSGSLGTQHWNLLQIEHVFRDCEAPGLERFREFPKLPTLPKPPHPTPQNLPLHISPQYYALLCIPYKKEGRVHRWFLGLGLGGGGIPGGGLAIYEKPGFPFSERGLFAISEFCQQTERVKALRGLKERVAN